MLSQLQSFVLEQVPELMVLCLRAVTEIRVPQSLSDPNWVFFLPVATGVFMTTTSILYSLHYILWGRKLPVFLSNTAAASAVDVDDTKKFKKKSLNKYLTRLILLRGMGLLYSVAFLTSALQSRALFGVQGLLPAPGIIASEAGTLHLHPRPVPAFTLLSPWCTGDLALEIISWMGLFFGILLMILPSAGRGVWTGLPLLLWGLYLSLVNLGGMIMNYGWEWETLEVGFLMIFLCPFFPSWPWFRSSGDDRLCHPHDSKLASFPTSEIVLWLLRWGTFRLMIGAGMSKIGQHSSDCWLELSCTETHYETQPMPNALAWVFHKLPTLVHKIEVIVTFFEQLVLPWFVLFPPVFGTGIARTLRQYCFLCEIFFQLCIVSTGNYAWINFVGIVPCLAMVDDEFLASSFLTKWLFTQDERSEADLLSQEDEIEKHVMQENEVDNGNKKRDDGDTDDEDRSRSSRQPSISQHSTPLSSTTSQGFRLLGKCVRFCLLVFILMKSVAPVKELFSAAPWLHFYDDYFFVNAQGVFGFINQHRVVLVLETSHAPYADLVEDLSAPLPQHQHQHQHQQDQDPHQHQHHSHQHHHHHHHQPHQHQEERHSSCIDRQGPVAKDFDGFPLQCAQLEEHCSQQGVAALCPVTCGTCPLNLLPLARLAPPVDTSSSLSSPSASASASASYPWTGTLEFKNIPGNVHRAPSFHSPYHYRFDWEVWIRTTASMEGNIPFDALKRIRSMGSADVSRTQDLLPDMSLPTIVKRMVAQVLRGDSDAIGLLANPRDSLIRCPDSVINGGEKNKNKKESKKETKEKSDSESDSESDSDNDDEVVCRPPTAIRARYFLYKFSSLSELANNGTWWTREAISKPRVILRDEATGMTAPRSGADDGAVRRSGRRSETRRSPWQRHWIMFSAVCGAVVSIYAVPTLGTDLHHEKNMLLLLLLLGHFSLLTGQVLVLLLALLADYPAVTFPIIGQLPAANAYEAIYRLSSTGSAAMIVTGVVSTMTVGGISGGTFYCVQHRMLYSFISSFIFISLVVFFAVGAMTEEVILSHIML